MPWTCLVRSANARRWGRTGQRAPPGPARSPGSCHSGAAPCDQVRGQGRRRVPPNRSAPAGRRRRPAGPARAAARPAAAARPGPDGTAARPAGGSHARSASRRRPRTGRPFHAVAHHEFFLLISPAQRSSLPDVVSFSVTTDRPAQGRCEAGKRSSPDPGDPPRRDSAGRDGTAAARAGECGGTGVRARLTARSLG